MIIKRGLCAMNRVKERERGGGGDREGDRIEREIKIITTTTIHEKKLQKKTHSYEKPLPTRRTIDSVSDCLLVRERCERARVSERARQFFFVPLCHHFFFD